MVSPRKSAPKIREAEELSPKAIKALIDVLKGREELLTAEEAIKELEVCRELRL